MSGTSNRPLEALRCRIEESLVRVRSVTCVSVCVVCSDVGRVEVFASGVRELIDLPAWSVA